MSSSRRQNGSVLDRITTENDDRDIPDGGHGWLVFLATLFFQGLIPSLIVSYGVFLSYLKLELQEPDPNNRIVHNLWDESMTHVPLFFSASWIFLDPISRKLIVCSLWPRLVGTAGTCLTCAGLLFMWMGFLGENRQTSSETSVKALFILSGLLSGFGSSILIAQCEILLAQYFRLKHRMLSQFTHAVVGFGFVLTPIVIGNCLIRFSLLRVVLWYQAIILQGLIVNIVFRKPLYLKNGQSRYQYVAENAEDEQDVFSKSLSVISTTQNSNKSNTEQESETSNENKTQKQWVTFEDDPDRTQEPGTSASGTWVTFNEENEPQDSLKNKPNGTNSMLTNAFSSDSSCSTLSVNVNTSYNNSFADEIGAEVPPIVFIPPTENNTSYKNYTDLLKQPTFYKSLLTVVTTRYSVFLFYFLFPSYLFLEVTNLRLKQSSTMVGLISVGSFLFSLSINWFDPPKNKRPLLLSILCWLGALGYALLANFFNEYLLVIGAGQVALSITCLQHVGGPLMGLQIRGNTNAEHTLVCIITGLSFILFLTINFTIQNCFRFMAMLHFMTGLTWISNFLYKKIRVVR